MRYILILVFIALLFSCEKESTHVCKGAEFIFVDQNGNDIFSKNTPNHLELSDFRAYSKDSINRLNFTDTLNGMNVFDIWIYAMLENKNNYTFLKFGNLTIDTLFAKLTKDGNSFYISELYYNDSLIEKNSSCAQIVHTITIKTE